MPRLARISTSSSAVSDIALFRPLGTCVSMCAARLIVASCSCFTAVSCSSVGCVLVAAVVNRVSRGVGCMVCSFVCVWLVMV